MEPARDPNGAVEFFQLVRLLERQLWAARAQHSGATTPNDEPGVGEWGYFVDEPIRFRAANTLANPDRAVAAVRRDSVDSAHPAWLVDVSFMGLIGPSGVLPPHITSLLLGEGEAAKSSLRDFLALFEHRFIARFYRAWEQTRLVLGFERAVRQNHDDNTHDFTLAIRALTGLAERELTYRLAVSDRLPAFYSGLLSNQVRPAECLARMVTAAFQVPCGLVEFVAEWQAIPQRQQTRLGNAGEPGSRQDRWNSQLGSTACAGSRVWTVQDRFRVQLGPLDYPTFVRLMPAGDLFSQLCDLIRLYVGRELAFDIQPILAPDQVPRSQLRGQSDGETRLGWNSWLISRPFQQPATDAVFSGSS